MKIDFSLEQLAVLDRAVQQLPYHVAAPLIAHINQELTKEKRIMETPIDAEGVINPKTHQQNGV